MNQSESLRHNKVLAMGSVVGVGQQKCSRCAGTTEGRLAPGETLKRHPLSKAIAYKSKMEAIENREVMARSSQWAPSVRNDLFSFRELHSPPLRALFGRASVQWDAR